MRKHLHRLGHPVGRCWVERLVRGAGLHAVVRGSDRPLSGDWDGEGGDEPALAREPV